MTTQPIRVLLLLLLLLIPHSTIITIRIQHHIDQLRLTNIPKCTSLHLSNTPISPCVLSVARWFDLLEFPFLFPDAFPDADADTTLNSIPSKEGKVEQVAIGEREGASGFQSILGRM
ncbi:hypothetical protein CPB84DRAFT_1790230 [Gymnopilus junonius]|uniref:Uncharacterized protein n=1 Tax=Gymnopilus junonius TaxID=109634 RepID=A0A9P5NF96_GYMJU|nr:hypothetical protein CPB84DRAFT_1790230 [Gymnopilus junonius]